MITCENTEKSNTIGYTAIEDTIDQGLAQIKCGGHGLTTQYGPQWPHRFQDFDMATIQLFDVSAAEYTLIYLHVSIHC